MYFLILSQSKVRFHKFSMLLTLLHFCLWLYSTILSSRVVDMQCTHSSRLHLRSRGLHIRLHFYQRISLRLLLLTILSWRLRHHLLLLIMRGIIERDRARPIILLSPAKARQLTITLIQSLIVAFVFLSTLWFVSMIKNFVAVMNQMVNHLSLMQG